MVGGLTAGTYTGENIVVAYKNTTRNVTCIGTVNSVEIWNVTLQAAYSTLKGAFDAINKGTYKGALEVRIIGNTVETASAVLYQSGYTGAGGTSNYSSVMIYPTVDGITVTGYLTTPLIDLNGADNVILDGSVNGLGSTKSLVITNTNASNTGGTSTIRFINSAESNTVRYCIIKGSETSALSGVIFFSTSTAGNGNDGNTIENNDITSSTTGRPINAILSVGSSSHENNGNIILNNNIFDFWHLDGVSSAIMLGAYTTDITVSKNSFYETTSLALSANATYQMIMIDNASGNNFTVSDNYFGGQTSLCGGSPLSVGMTGTLRSLTFDAIQVKAGTTTATSVHGNIISNINIRSSNVSPFRAINAVAGTLNIGTVTGNTIGSDTGNGSIIVTGTVGNCNVYGIYIASAYNVDCQNNTIGSIITANATANATNLYGIYKTATAGATTISDNIIGSKTSPNSLNTSSPATGNSQLL